MMCILVDLIYFALYFNMLSQYVASNVQLRKDDDDDDIYIYNIILYIILYYIMEAGHGNPLQYSCLENSQGQRSLAGCSP